MFFFFCFKQKTAYEMRISDWSSDVCSSDLIASGKSLVQTCFEALGVPVLDADQVSRDVVMPGTTALAQIATTFGTDFLLPGGELDRRRLRAHVFGHEIGRASCRERVWQ